MQQQTLQIRDVRLFLQTASVTGPSSREAAGEYPDVQFCHATGTQAAASGLSNMHNYFTNIYEARYVSGVVAGLKLNEMIKDGTITEDNCKMGYVGAFPCAEVISGYTFIWC